MAKKEREPSIRLHPKHGLNPTVPQCFWCGEDKNEVALLGAALNKQAPMHMVLDYEPCDRCRAQWEQGIVLVECVPADPTRPRPELVKGTGAYPSGRFIVVTEEAWERLELFKPEMKEAVTKARKAFVEKAVFEAMLPPEQKQEEAGNDDHNG